MLPPLDYSQLEQEIYEAAVLPERWPDVLTRLGEISHSAGAVLLCLNERGPHFVNAPALDRLMQRFVSEGWAERNSRVQTVLAKGLVGVPRFINEDEFLLPGEAEADRMVNELHRPEGLGWVAGFMVGLPHGDLVVMSLEQYWERGPVRGEALDRLNRLYPHLARAALLAGRIDFERMRTAVETLAAVGLPAAAVTPRGRIVLANDAFVRADHTLTARGGDRLALRDRAADALLSMTLPSLNEADSPRSLPLRSSPGGPVTSVLHLVPIRRLAHDIFGSTAAIAVLSQPKQGVSPATLVHSLFDLTPAELAVAQQVAAGRSAAQIAQQSGRSINTVRNQLKSVMAKTGTSRQAELAVLMHQLKSQEE